MTYFSLRFEGSCINIPQYGISHKSIGYTVIPSSLPATTNIHNYEPFLGFFHFYQAKFDIKQKKIFSTFLCTVCICWWISEINVGLLVVGLFNCSSVMYFPQCVLVLFTKDAIHI